jgi:hypothetical protein
MGDENVFCRHVGLFAMCIALRNCRAMSAGLPAGTRSLAGTSPRILF